jgi:phosphoglycolate phosphatase-like HAD superfamily hydrolase
MKLVIFDCDGTLLNTNQLKPSFFPGIKELLLDLAVDCQLFVWTARGRASTLRILEENGVRHLFEAISTPDDAPSKPHIKGLFDLVGSHPKNSICVIGDSSMDIIGARNFGVMAIGAVWNTSVEERFLREAGADFIVSHPSECSTLVRSNLTGI